ncbi:MAG: glutamine amidotransferase-related protein, partial [Thermodesulfobacteriota bacterium]
MFLLIDNFDSFTYNLVQAFQALGANPRVIRNDQEEILSLARHPELRGVVISPGPGGPEDTGFCPEMLKILPANIPVLGVCLGFHTLAHFAGYPIIRANRIMHGKTSSIYHYNKD